MANKDGIITRKDLITDDALNFGEVYTKNLLEAEKANKSLIDSVKELNKQVLAFKTSNSQKDYITAKQAEALATQQAIDAIKIQEAAEISMNKIRLSSIAVINAEKKAVGENTVAWKEQKQLEDGLISTKRKNELASEGTNKALVKERILLSETNKEIKQQAREQLGLVGTYERINRARLEAQKRLAELLSAEKQNIAEIARAQIEFEKLDARVKAVDAAIKNYSKNIGNYSSAFSGLNETAKELLSTFGLVTGLALFAQILKDVFNVVKEFDRQLIAVGKTANINGEALKEFGRAVVDLGGDLDGISIEGLLKSAEVAGTLGVQGTENILKFSKAIEELKLTSDIISDEQVGQFAKFIEVSQDSFENADRLASVITRLGNEFATTEAEVLSNSTEIQKGISVYNASAQSVLGLGSATATLGNEAEVSASSIQKGFGVINKAIATGENLKEVLKLTGLTQKELSKQFKADASGTFVKFVEGLSKAKNEGQNLQKVLEDVDLAETRTFKVIGSLASNYEILKNSMIAANEEYKLNAALSAEVDKASKSLESIVNDIKDKWQEYILTTSDANAGTEKLAKVLTFLRDNLQTIINAIVKYGTVLLVFIGVQRTVNFLTSAWTAIQVAATTAQIQFAISTGIGTKAILEQAAAAKAAAAATEELNIATKASPWGLILGLISAIVVAYMVFNDELSENEKLVKRIADENKNLQETENFYNKQSDIYRDKTFKGIEDEIKLRKAKGENSDKLDKEEISRKKEVVEAEIKVYEDLKKLEIDRTKNQIAESQKRLDQADKEFKTLQAKINQFGSGASVGKAQLESQQDDVAKKRAAANAEVESLKNKLGKLSAIEQEELKKKRKILSDLELDANVRDAEIQAEEDKKAKAARLKRLKEAYEAEKKAADDLFKLRQFRLQVAIDLDKEIMDNEKAGQEERINALLESQQLYEAKIKEAAEREFQLLGKYNEEKGVLVRELTDVQIAEILRTQTISENATAEQKLIFEKLQNDLTNALKKGEKDRQKLIDEQVAISKKAADEQVAAKEAAMNREIELENKSLKNTLDILEANKKINEEAIKKATYKKDSDGLKAATDNQKTINDALERATEEHERRVFEIRKKYAIESLNLQISTLEKLLEENSKLPANEQVSADKIKVIQNDLQKYKTEVSALELTQYKGNSEEKFQIEKVTAEQVLSISQNLANSIVDLTNAIFDAKIAKIDAEIQASDAYYQGEIDKAGNDARKKDLLQQEAEKKRQVLEEKKKKEQYKQAVINKTMAAVNVGLSTAMAIMQAYAQMGPIAGNAGAILAGIMGAIQLAAVLAAPIPKYRLGRKDGPEEFAFVGDGGVNEVIERKKGGVEITPATTTLVKLNAGDKVHSSVDEYLRLQRASVMSSIEMEGRRMKDIEATVVFAKSYDKELLEEIKATRKALEKKKPNQTTINIDLGHYNWRKNNITWN